MAVQALVKGDLHHLHPLGTGESPVFAEGLQFLFEQLQIAAAVVIVGRQGNNTDLLSLLAIAPDQRDHREPGGPRVVQRPIPLGLVAYVAQVPGLLPGDDTNKLLHGNAVLSV